ncbi:MAG: hypothetical protein WCG15_00710 [Actinomycetes bacterium]|jgi:BMFP domain-containing protein YqiC
MDQEFINTYIEKMARKIEELTRLDLIAQTQLEISQKLISGLQVTIGELNGKVERLEASLNKKASKSKETNEF